MISFIMMLIVLGSFVLYIIDNEMRHFRLIKQLDKSWLKDLTEEECHLYSIHMWDWLSEPINSNKSKKYYLNKKFYRHLSVLPIYECFMCEYMSNKNLGCEDCFLSNETGAFCTVLYTEWFQRPIEEKWMAADNLYFFLFEKYGEKYGEKYKMA